MNTDLPQNRSAVCVEVQNLSKSYGDHVIFHNLNLTIQPGEIFVLMGPSGTGKSVFLKTLMGFESPNQGRVWINHLDIADEQTRQKVVMAMVFQSGALFNSMTVFDNLAFYLRQHRIYPEAVILQKVNRILHLLGIKRAAELLPAELSGGMKKRVSIARALVMEPQLLLYDEPTSELDAQTAAMIAEMIGTLKEEIGVTSIIVSHDKSLAFSIADRVGFLMDGQLCAVGRPQDVRALEDTRIQSFLNPKIDLKNPRFRQTIH